MMHKQATESQSMNTLQANKGGELHHLSDKFYKGGQFMPEPDKLAGTKRKAREAAATIEAFSRPEIGDPINGKIPVRVIPRGWTKPKAMIWVKTSEEAIAARAEFRAAIEARLGGRPINWAE
jgi:hypothetical protein